MTELLRNHSSNSLLDGTLAAPGGRSRPGSERQLSRPFVQQPVAQTASEEWTGASEYRPTERLPEQLRGRQPSVEELEREMGSAEGNE
jgi:hypothetical protein